MNVFNAWVLQSAEVTGKVSALPFTNCHFINQ